MLFYYIWDVYQKNQLGARLDKRQLIPGVNIISRKVSIANINGAMWSGGQPESLSRGFRGVPPENVNMNGSNIYDVKVKIQAGNI